MSPGTLREMQRDDIPQVSALELLIYPQPWSPRVFFDELAQPNRVYVVVEDEEGVVIAYGGFLMVEEDAHITTLAVDPRVRRARVGTRLMLDLVERALVAGARHLTLEVRVSNQAAQHLYDRFGFAPVEMRKDYYVDEDALVMWAIDIDTPEYAERLTGIRATLEAMR